MLKKNTIYFKKTFFFGFYTTAKHWNTLTRCAKRCVIHTHTQKQQLICRMVYIVASVSVLHCISVYMCVFVRSACVSRASASRECNTYIYTTTLYTRALSCSRSLAIPAPAASLLTCKCTRIYWITEIRQRALCESFSPPPPTPTPIPASRGDSLPRASFSLLDYFFVFLQSKKKETERITCFFHSLKIETRDVYPIRARMEYAKVVKVEIAICYWV